jgi:hypothetical protein
LVDWIDLLRRGTFLKESMRYDNIASQSSLHTLTRSLYYSVVNSAEGPTGQGLSDFGFKNVGSWWPYGNKGIGVYEDITPDVYEDLRDGKIAEHIEQLCLELREYLNNHKEIYPME